MNSQKIIRKRAKLDNGINLVYVFLPYSYSSAVGAYVVCGSRFDPQEHAGLAHFMEHMTLSGTKKYPSAEKLHTAIEQYGAWYEAFTYPDYVYFTIKFADDHLEKMAENLAERLVNPLFKQKDVKETRGNILQELYLNKTNPQIHIWGLWQETIWQETLLSRNYLGTEKSLRDINRDTLLNFYHNYYGANNTVFFYVGNKSYQEVADVFQHYFKNYNPIRINRLYRIKRYNRLTRDKFPKIKPERKTPIKIYSTLSKQLTFAYGFKTEGLTSLDYNALELLQIILGIGWSSRLGRRLFLENGLVYEWLMNYHQLLDNGYLMFQSATQKENFNKVLRVINEEIMDIKNNGIKKAELDKAKNYYQGNLLANTETSLEFMHWYGRSELFEPKKVKSVEKKCEEIKRIKLDEIQRVCQKYCHDKNWYLSVIGKIKKEEIKTPVLF